LKRLEILVLIVNFWKEMKCGCIGVASGSNDLSLLIQREIPILIVNVSRKRNFVMKSDTLLSLWQCVDDLLVLVEALATNNRSH